MYFDKAPLIPELHRCAWCRKRLSRKNKDDIIVHYTGEVTEQYFCNKECAKQWVKAVNKESIRVSQLNSYIKGNK